MEFKKIIIRGGLVTNVAPSLLDDDKVQDVQNIVFDAKDGLPRKRLGQTRAFTTALANYPIRGMVVNHRKDGTVYTYIVCGGEIWYSTDLREWNELQVPANATEDMTVSNALDFEGIVWNNKVILTADARPIITNTKGGDMDSLDESVAILIDGTTVYAIIDTSAADTKEVLITDFADFNFEQCKFIIKQYSDRLINRIFLAGSDTEPNGVWWTNAITGDLADESFDPTHGLNYTYVGKDDGEIITGIASYQGNIFVFKPHSVYRIQAFGDKETWQVMRLPTTHGCMWQRTIKEWNGKLTWMSWDGVWALDGLKIIELSEPIRPSLANLPQNEDVSRFWIQTTNADWDAGSKTNISADPESWEDFEDTDIGLTATTESVEDSITTGVNDKTLGYYDPDYNIDRWYWGVQFSVGSDNINVTKLTVNLYKNGSPPNVTVYIYNDSDNIPTSYISGSTKTILASDVSSSAFGDITVTYTIPVKLEANTKYWLVLKCVGGDSSNNIRWKNDTSESGERIASYANNDWTIISDQALKFAIYEQHYPTTGTNTLVSATKDLGSGVSPGAWGRFQVSQDLNVTGTLTYHLDTSVDGSAWDGYVQVYDGQVPNVRTDRRYFRFKCTFVTTSGHYTPIVSAIRVNWYTTTPHHTPCAYVHKRRYNLCVQSEDGDFNDTRYRIDRNNNWTKDTGVYATIFDLHRFQPISGGAGKDNTVSSGDNGFVMLQESGDQDRGAAFVSFLVTKTFDTFAFGACFRHVYVRSKNNVAWEFYVNVDDLKSGTIFEWGTAYSIAINSKLETDKITMKDTIEGKRIMFKISQDSTDAEWVFGGFEMAYILRKSRR